jgi:hypothetical protein
MKGGACLRCEEHTWAWKISMVGYGDENEYWLCHHCKNLMDFETELDS